ARTLRHRHQGHDQRGRRRTGPRHGHRRPRRGADRAEMTQATPRSPASGNRPPITGHRLLATVYRPLATAYRPLAAVACLLLLAGCPRRETAVEQGNRAQILHRSIGQDIAEIDPHLVSAIAEMDIDSALFEGLVSEDPVDLPPVPAVATVWDVSPDQL